MRACRVAAVSLAFLLIPAAACTTTRTYEIDASSVRDFQWNGKIRVTEQTTDELGPFLTFSKETRAHSVELVGRGGRNIVVRPTGHAAAQHPIGRVETPGDVNRPVEQVLAMAAHEAYPRLARSVEWNRPTQSAASSDEAEQAGNDLQRLMSATVALQEGRYGELTVAEAITAASGAAPMSHTIFNLPDGRYVKACSDGKNPQSLCAVIYDRDGRVLHEYRPVALPVREIPPSSQP